MTDGGGFGRGERRGAPRRVWYPRVPRRHSCVFAGDGRRKPRRTLFATRTAVSTLGPISSSSIVADWRKIVPPELDPVLLVPSARRDVEGVQPRARHAQEQVERVFGEEELQGVDALGREDAAPLQHLLLPNRVLSRRQLEFLAFVERAEVHPRVELLDVLERDPSGLDDVHDALALARGVNAGLVDLGDAVDDVLIARRELSRGEQDGVPDLCLRAAGQLGVDLPDLVHLHRALLRDRLQSVALAERVRAKVRGTLRAGHDATSARGARRGAARGRPHRE
mmetsp:Transcript_8556/g.35039  ORF Transcript_8556/g.35039 Transcript_8556/m.35039 type:complete len:281 (+) Transcript_8556:81-923(+)